MKKTIKAVELFENTTPITLHLDYTHQNTQKSDDSSFIHHTHHLPIYRDKNAQISKLKNKPFPHPVVSQLRHLVINCIQSADYFANCIQKQLPEAALKLYYRDSSKLTHFLNCLIVTEIPTRFSHSKGDGNRDNYRLEELGVFKRELQRVSKKKYEQHKDNLQFQRKIEQKSLQGKINQLQKLYTTQNLSQIRSPELSAVTQNQFYLKASPKLQDKRERKIQANRVFNSSNKNQLLQAALSGSAQYKDRHVNQKRQFSRMRMRMQQSEKQTHNLKVQNHQLRIQLEKVNNTSKYMELGLFKSQQMILQFASYFENNHTNYLLDRDKISLLLSSLDSYLAFTRNQNSPYSAQSVLQRMKHEMEVMIAEVTKHKQYSMQLIRQKQILVEEASKRKRQQQLQDDLQYEQMKRQINKLNEDLGELTGELNKKDEIIEEIRIRNETLQQDLVTLQKMNRRINQNEKLLIEELGELEEQKRAYQMQIEQLQDINQELNREIHQKYSEIQIQFKEIQLLRHEKMQLQKQSRKSIEDKNHTIAQLEEQNKIAQLQKQAILELNEKIQNKNILLEQEARLLEQNLEQSFYDNDQLKRNLQTLKRQNQLLTLENKQFQQSMKMLDEWKQGYQQNINLIKQQCDNLKNQLKSVMEDCSSKKAKIQLLEKQNRKVLSSSGPNTAPRQHRMHTQNEIIDMNPSPFRDQLISPIRILHTRSSAQSPNILNEFGLNQLMTSQGYIDNASSISINNDDLHIIDENQENVQFNPNFQDQVKLKYYSDEDRLYLTDDIKGHQFKDMPRYDKRIYRSYHLQGNYSDDQHLIDIYHKFIRQQRIHNFQDQNKDQGSRDDLAHASMKVNLDKDIQTSKLQQTLQFEYRNCYQSQQISEQLAKNMKYFKNYKKETNETRDSRKQLKRQNKQRQEESRSYFISDGQYNLISSQQIRSQQSLQSRLDNNC